MASPAKNKKILVVGITALIVALALGGTSFMLLGGKSKRHGDKAEGGDEEHAKPAPMVVFEEKFTVNLLSEDGSSHYMQVPKLELEMANEAAAKRVEERKSKVSDRINSAMRSKTLGEMLEPGSDIKLKEALKKVINDTLEVKPQDADRKGVKEVILPASFIVQ